MEDMMTFDDWMLSERVTYKPSDDSMQDRLLRRCWNACAEASQVEIERFSELADSEGTRAVTYLRRARKAEAALKAIRDHWREFGPEHGFDETLETVCRVLEA